MIAPTQPVVALLDDAEQQEEMEEDADDNELVSSKLGEYVLYIFSLLSNATLHRR